MNISKLSGGNESFSTAGERLNHILDVATFRKGRGRVSDFHAYLVSKDAETFADLKYTTVRSWFQDHAPPMRKIDAVMVALGDEHQFTHDLSQIKMWWKLGGNYPFSDEFDSNTRSLQDIQHDAQQNQEKLQFLIMGLITDELGNRFSETSAEDLVAVKEAVMTFANDYADPFKTECPTDYLRLAVKYALNK